MSRLLHSLPSELRLRRVLLFVLLLAVKTLNLCRSNVRDLLHSRWFARVCTCTYSAIIKAVQVFNCRQTGSLVQHIYDGVGFAKFAELERNEHLIFQKIFNLFSFLFVGKLSLASKLLT